MGRLAFEAVPRALDNTGAPINGAELYTYAAGTTTPVTTYSDSALMSAQAFPVESTSDGFFPQIYVPAGQYKVVVKDADGVTLFTADNIDQDFLSTSGGELSGQLKLADGSVGTPAMGFASDTNTGWYWVSADRMAAAAGGAKKVDIQTDRVDFADGITFGATGDIIDTYDEGTWTPVLTDGTNNATMSVNAGIYRRLNNAVQIGMGITVTSLGSVSGAVKISGLPFTCVNQSTHIGSGAMGRYANVSVTAGYSIGYYVVQNTTTIQLTLLGGTGGIANLQETNLSGTSTIFINTIYHTS